MQQSQLFPARHRIRLCLRGSARAIVVGRHHGIHGGVHCFNPPDAGFQ